MSNANIKEAPIYFNNNSTNSMKIGGATSSTMSMGTLSFGDLLNYSYGMGSNTYASSLHAHYLPKSVTAGSTGSDKLLVFFNGKPMSGAARATAGKDGTVVTTDEKILRGDVLIVHEDLVNLVLTGSGHDPLLTSDVSVTERFFGIKCKSCDVQLGRSPGQPNLCTKCSKSYLPLWKQSPTEQFVCTYCNKVHHVSNRIIMLGGNDKCKPCHNK